MHSRSVVEEIAKERIAVLFGLAQKTASERPEFSHKYVKTLRQISSHYKVQIPKKMRAQICTNCSIILAPGINATVRVVSSKRYVAYKCNRCGRERHIPY